MFYLVFQPYRKKENATMRNRYDYRNQTFVGFTSDFNEALKLAYDESEANHQIYEVENPTLSFKMKDCIRYGFRKHFGVLLPFKRSVDGSVEFINNPFESPEENQRRLDEIKAKRLEGLNRRKQQLADLEKKITDDEPAKASDPEKATAE